jgi:hypothetical protein
MAARVREALPRLAFTAMEAPAVLGVSHDFFAEHIAPELRWVWRGAKKLVAAAELERWLDREAAKSTQRLEDMVRERAENGFYEDELDADGKLLRRRRKTHPADAHLLLKGRRPEVYRDGAHVAVNATAVALPSIRHEAGLTRADGRLRPRARSGA